MRPRPPLYSFAEVTRHHGPAFALHVDGLEVPAGEVFALLGPTGAGKSTLLRMLAGLEAPSGGDLRFGPHRLNGAELPLAARRRIAMVHQRPVLLRGTVRENIEYPLRWRQERNGAQTAEEIGQRLGLARIARQDAGTLSGGQAQLVALARALVLCPDVLLLDEPTSNLDPAHVALVEETIADLRRGKGMTVVWATHNLFQARRVADRVALLLGGRLVETADCATFFESPRDPRTADFVAGRIVY